MKKSTIGILQSFATINQGIVFRKGNVLKTMSAASNIFATAKVDEDFPQEFAIYNLPEFLAILSLFDAPSIDYSEKYVTVSQGKSKIRYVYSNPDMVISPPVGKDIPIKNVVLKFKLSKEQLGDLLKAAAILKSTDLVIDKSGITAISKKGSDNSYRVDIEDVEDTSEDSKKKYDVRIDSLRLIPMDYVVSVTDRFIAFEGTDVSYIVTLEKTAEK